MKHTIDLPNVSENLKKSNLSSIIAQLHSQIVRRKRDTTAEDDGKEDANGNGNGDSNGNGNGHEGKKKNKYRGPCEPLASETYMKIEIVRPSKDPSESFGQGMIVKVTCEKGYTSNLANTNSTVKCVRGRWKPVRPACTMSKFC
jgi:hypothetical protein